MNIAGHQGLTIAGLIAALSNLPGDLLVLIEADATTKHLMLVTETEDAADQPDIDDDSTNDDFGYVVLSAVELPFRIDDALAELNAELDAE